MLGAKTQLQVLQPNRLEVMAKLFFLVIPPIFV